MKISIVSEFHTSHQAQSLSYCFENIEAQIAIAIKEHFPTGDAMLPFLLGLSSQSDRNFLLITA